MVSARRAAIQEIVKDTGRVLTVRDMGAILKTKGHAGNHQTVCKDYLALGIQREQKAKTKESGANYTLFYCMQPVDKNLSVDVATTIPTDQRRKKTTSAEPMERFA